MKHGAKWYQRRPHEYLGGVVGLTARQHAVYSVVLDLLYAYGGEINNKPEWIAGWISDMGVAAVRNTLAELFALGKLIQDADKITEKHAKNEAKTQEKLSENAREIAKKRWKSEGDISQNQGLSDAGRIIKPDADKIREDKKKEEEEIPSLGIGGPGEREPRAKAARPTRGTRLKSDFRPPPEWIAWAITEGLSKERAERAATEFVDYWCSRSGGEAAKLDWFAVWRNRVRHLVDRRGNGGGQRQGPVDPIEVGMRLLRRGENAPDVPRGQQALLLGSR